MTLGPLAYSSRVSTITPFQLVTMRESYDNITNDYPLLEFSKLKPKGLRMHNPLEQLTVIRAQALLLKDSSPKFILKFHCSLDYRAHHTVPVMRYYKIVLYSDTPPLLP